MKYIKMLGEEMSLEISRHTIERFEERMETKLGEMFDFTERITFLLEQESISEILLFSIDFDEKIVITDFLFNYSAVCVIRAHGIEFITLHHEVTGKSLNLFDGQKVIEVFKNNVRLMQYVNHKKQRFEG